MPLSLTPQDVLRFVREKAGAGGRVHVPGCSGEPTIFVDAYAADPSLAEGLTFFGIWIPGVNRTDWAALNETARAETIFLSPDYRVGFEARRTSFRPLSYTQAWRALGSEPCDVALVQVAPPDADGMCSLGVSPDFAPAVAQQARVTVAHINPLMPVPRDGERLPLASFDAVVEAPCPVLEAPPPTLDPAFAAIARHVANLVPEGATLQFGIGKVQLAVLQGLSGATGLRIHSGMASDPVLSLLSGDTIADEPGAITIGVAMGSRALYNALAEDPRVRFRPVGFTHDIRTLAAIPRFVAVNSVIEVDLFGQANAEFIGGQQVSGTGGLVDFLRGARVSDGGLPITALVSTAKGGSVSRIVPRLAPDAVSIARADVGVVVTEHGVADVRTLDVDARAAALIAIADPAHQPALTDAWRAMRGRL